jgi:predicted metal-dependent hydrolase
VNYVVTNGTSRRYTYLRFRPDMTLEIVVPKGRRVDPRRTIDEKLSWISLELERMASARVVLGSDRVMYDGSYLTIKFDPCSRDGLFPDLSRGEIVVQASDKSRIKELIRRWFFKESSSYAVSAVNELAPLVGVRPTRVDVREIGKWGYCTRKGRVSFSWQLISLPNKLREYIVLHELTHLLFFDHSSAFKNALSRVCSDFRHRETELDSIIPYSMLPLD